MRHALAAGAFALSILGFGSMAQAHTVSPTLSYTDTTPKNAQALSPDVEVWTSHLIMATPAQARLAIRRLLLTLVPVGPT